MEKRPMAGHDRIELQSCSFPRSGGANDSFIFTDAPESSSSEVVVDAGDVDNARRHHTPEWSNLRSGDPMETPGPDDDLAGLPAVQMDDGHAVSHALYQDLLPAC